MTFSFSRSLLAASLGLSLVLSSASAFADKAYRTHTCFIDDQEVSGFQEVCDLVKDDVRVGATARVDMQKPRGVARLKRCLRDAVIREDVIKRI